MCEEVCECAVQIDSHNFIRITIRIACQHVFTTRRFELQSFTPGACVLIQLSILKSFDQALDTHLHSLHGPRHTSSFVIIIIVPIAVAAVHSQSTARIGGSAGVQRRDKTPDKRSQRLAGIRAPHAHRDLVAAALELGRA